MIYDNVLELIGHTPLVRLRNIAKDVPATVACKLESFNPGNSVKDRIAVRMLDDAEKKGLIQPGGTIVEATSGNTGMGLALAAIVRGYKCICTMSDKQSKEKIDILKAVGVKVIVTPTAVAPDDPRSYYSVANKLSKEIPNAYYPNQYYNMSNQEAHYWTTGPEVWEQTEGKITHFVAGVGTGGTISGVGRYLKEQNPDIKVWGIDTYGSVFKKYHETGEFDHNEVYPYVTEGIGEDIIPSNVDFSVIDRFEKVTDKDSFLMQRRLAEEEGILAGNSCGSAVKGFLQLASEVGPDDLVVILLPDHATRYLNKTFNDEWMTSMGYLEDKEALCARDILVDKALNPVVSAHQKDTIFQAIETMRNNGISQMPVMDDEGKIVGSITEDGLYHRLMTNPETRYLAVENIMEDPLPILQYNESYSAVLAAFRKGNEAIMLQDGRDYAIVTKEDLIHSLAAKS
jgi:cystathionine beta-synthase